MVETEDFRSRYEGDSSNDEFPFGFYVTNKSQVRVVKTGTDGIDLPDLVVDVDYSVGGVANSDSSTWKITYPISGTKLAPDEFVTIVPNYDLTQLTPFRTQGSFFPQLHENAFDYLTRIAQMQQEQLDRTVKVSVGSTTDPDDLISDLQTAEANAAASASAAAASAAAATAAAAMSSAMPLWVTATSYSVGAVIRYTDEKIYRCATAHTSGTFATDLAASKWVELSPTVNDNLKKTITQASHGFVAGDTLKFASGVWAKAQADSAANSEAEGVVESSVDTNNFVVVLGGYCTLSGLTKNTEYYLSPSTAGLMTGTVPTTAGQIIRRIGKAISTTVLIVNIQQPGVQVV